MDMANCLYYTFSTISQTIATGLGLLAAFVLFRLDKLDRSLSENTQWMLRRFIGKITLDFYEKQDWCGMVSHFKNESSGYRSDVELTKVINEIALIYPKIPLIKGMLKTAIILTLMTILYSVGALVFVPGLIQVSWLPQFALGIGFGFLTTCLTFYFRLIGQTIQ